MLPNSPNVIMAAERAAELSEKRVRVVPDALAAGGPRGGRRARPRARRGRQRRGDAGGARAGAHRRGRRRRARRRRGRRRFAAATPSASSTSELVAWGEPADDAAQAVLGELGASAELVTCIAGDGAPLDGDAVAALAPDGVELETRCGGQPSLLVAARRRVALEPHRCRVRAPRHDGARSRRRSPSRRSAPLGAASCAPTAAPRCRGRRGSPTPLERRRPRRRPRAPSGSGCRRSATCSSTCRATAARRARSPSSRPARPRPWSSRCARSRRGPCAGAA